MGIHYDYKSKRGERAMLKEAKRKARIIKRRSKRMSSSTTEGKEEIKTHDIEKIITLGKKGDLQSKRKAISILRDEKNTKKVFNK